MTKTIFTITGSRFIVMYIVIISLCWYSDWKKENFTEAPLQFVKDYNYSFYEMIISKGSRPVQTRFKDVTLELETPEPIRSLLTQGSS